MNMTEPTVSSIVQHLQTLVAERKPTLSNYFQAFNAFVATHDDYISKNVVDILNAFHPKTQLEKNLRCRLVDKYRVSSEIVASLRSGDSYKLKQALKCDWFFEKCPEPNFVADTLPTLSYLARVKTLNKYASCLKNVEFGEILYGQTKVRYGAKAALPLLPSCGENFIRNELPNLKTSLPPTVALALYKKYPSLAIEYFKYLVDDNIPKNASQKRVLSIYSGVFTKLATVDLKSFLELFNEHHRRMPSVRLGRRPTKKLIKTEGDKFICEYDKYGHILVDKTFISRLSYEQLKKLYTKSLLPGNVADFLRMGEWDRMIEYLRYVKQSARSELIWSTFKTKYGREPTSEDILFKLSDHWEKYLPLESKIRFLENKIASTEDPVQQSRFIAKLQIDQSIPRLRKLLESQSNSNVRSEVASQLIVTLRVNQYSSGIKDTFAYLVKRFRNETRSFRESIVYEMPSLGSLYLDLEMDDWKPIEDFIDIMKLNNEICYYKYNLRQIYSYKIHGCHLKKGDVEGCMAKYLDFEREEKDDLDTNALYLCEKTPYYKDCLLWFLREIPKMKWSDEERKSDVLIHLAENIVNYNEKEPKNRIDLPDWILDSLERYLVSTDPVLYHCNKVVSIFYKINKERLMSQFSSYVKLFNFKMICSFLTENPDKIMANMRIIMEKAFQSSFTSYSPFYKKVLLYETYGIPGEIRKFCRVVLKLQEPEYDINPEDSIFVNGSHAILALSLLESPETFLQLVSSYVPKEQKIEEYSTEVKRLYDVQESVCRSFVNVSTPSAVLPILRQFAVGDYLKLVVTSLLNVCGKVPENDLLALFKNWVDCPVSLRKHVFRLIHRIAPVNYSVAFFTNVFKTEKNASLRLVLFSKMFQTFIDEPSDESFDTLKSIIAQLTEGDEEALKNLFTIVDIDESYFSQYIELLWNLVNTVWKTVIPNGTVKVVQLVSDEPNTLKCFTEDFLYTLLCHELSTKYYSDSTFIYNYLLWSATIDVQKSRFDKLWRSVKPDMDSKWDEYKFTEGQVFQVRSHIKQFVSSLTAQAVALSNATVVPINLLTDVKTALSSLAKRDHLLKEMIILDLAILQLRWQSSSSSEKALFATRVAQLYREYLRTYGERCGHSLVDTLIKCAPSYAKEELTLELITKNDDPSCQIVGVGILESCISDEIQIPLYKNVIDVLTTSEHLGVQLAANELFSNLRSSLI